MSSVLPLCASVRKKEEYPLRFLNLILNRIDQLCGIDRAVDMLFDLIAHALFVLEGLLIVGITIYFLEKFVLGLRVQGLVEIHLHLFLWIVLMVEVLHRLTALRIPFRWGIVLDK